jgi:hypothetical protein
MGVFYSFNPRIHYNKVKEFLKKENLEYSEYKDNNNTRNVIEVLNYPNVNYLLFYYEKINNLVAHSSHDLAVIDFFKKISDFLKCEIESDNDEFIVPKNNRTLNDKSMATASIQIGQKLRIFLYNNYPFKSEVYEIESDLIYENEEFTAYEDLVNDPELITAVDVLDQKIYSKAFELFIYSYGSYEDWGYYSYNLELQVLDSLGNIVFESDGFANYKIIEG